MGAAPLPLGCEHSIERFADLLEAQLDAINLEKAHLVGNSLGGWLALELARRNRALSVVALAPGGGWQHGSKEQRRLLRKFKTTHRLLRVAGPVASVLTTVGPIRRIFLSDAVAQPSLLTALDAALLLKSIQGCTSFSHVLAALPKQPLAQPFTVTCPVRFVWGDKDRLLPLHGYSAHWRKVLPGAEWVVLKNAGHLPMYDAPEEVAKLILSLTRMPFACPAAENDQVEAPLVSARAS
jgi:pimeloyl-ACP methyl ester carboxylesterase